jgi:hypothetical protein
MRCQVLTLRDPFNPGRRTVSTVRRRRRIRAMAPKTRQPVIAYHNGRVILRKEWRRRVVDGDVIAFVVLPAGGGGSKNPLSMLLSIALSFAAGPMASALLMEAGAVQVIGGITLKTIVGGAISMAGNALINHAFAGKPSAPTPQITSNIAAASPTYNLNAQGNLARIDSAIPCQYGRMMAYPDFGAQPYAEYAGNEQYLYQLLCLGQGYYEIEAIRIEDTAITNFPEITYEIIEPGGTLTLFPSAVTTSVEVSGQELENGVAVGPFAANAAGTTTTTLAIDVVCPRGLYYANDSGGLTTVSVSFTVEARQIDADGAPLGGWVTLGSETISGATNTPQRNSYRYSGLTGARYEVKCTRTTAKGGSARYGDDLMWVGLRAYLPEVRTWPGQTMIALRMRASNSLSGQASRKINVISTRKLPIYSAGVWTAPQVTRSPAWAMADALRASYGAGLADSRIDINQLVSLAATCAARGDTFDARFDNTLTLWEALQKIGQAVRTRPYLQGGIVHFVRDEAATVPVVLYNMRSITRGSLSIDYILPTDETADAIDVGYFDGDVWSPRRVMASLPGSSETVPLKVDLFGVTDRDQAHREGVYLAAVNRYRRKRIKFATEMEGFIPAFGDLIAIAHDMPAWGVSGEVTSYNAGTKVISLSEPVTFGGGTHYIGLRSRNGSVSGPYEVTAGADAYKVVHVAATLDITPYTGGAAERTFFAFGEGETWRQPARVIAIRPRGLHAVEIEAVNEDDSVHTADSGVTAPAVQYSNLLNLYTAPVVAGLTVRSQVDDPGTILVSWQSAPGARYYIIDVSSDGDYWTRVGETTSNNYTVAAVYGNGTLVRVAAYGLTLGSSVQVAYATYSDYMWSAVDTDLMWSVTDTDLMWSA